MGFFCLMIMELLMGFMFNDNRAPYGLFRLMIRELLMGFSV